MPIYIEMGILYFAVKDYVVSKLCLELALPLCQTETSEAIVQQNLGTIYNALGEYQLAVAQFESAEHIFSKSENLSF